MVDLDHFAVMIMSDKVSVCPPFCQSVIHVIAITFEVNQRV